MSLFCDYKYFHLIQSQLERCKQIEPAVYNFRCPDIYCGDSQTNKFKSRGYIYERNNMLKFKCHNCGLQSSFSKFLNDFDSQLYKRYLFDNFKDKSEERGGLTSNKLSIKDEINNMGNLAERFSNLNTKTKEYPQLDNLDKLSDLPENHNAIIYCQSRLIPKSQYHRLFYTNHYKQFVNSIVPGKFSNNYDFPAIVFLLKSEQNKLIAVQGRCLDQSNAIRYLTATINGELAAKYGRLFGHECVDISKRVYVVEGPLDSLFLPNSIAACGSDLNRSIQFENATYILDCEPRNKQIYQKNKKLIKEGKSVCLLPSIEYLGQDINDMILNGKSSEDIKLLIDNHTYSGLRANIELNTWIK